MIRWGTAHFVDLESAYAYYRPYGFSPVEVRRKISDGEIKIGKPMLLLEGDKVVTVDGGKRYAIENNS